MKKIIYSYFHFFLFFVLSSCAANDVVVIIKIVDESSTALSDVNVKVLNTDQCCAGEDKPCSFVTDRNGGLSFIFSTGKAIRSDEVKKRECEFIINKPGYKSVKESFTYCVYGPCVGTQEINLKYKLNRSTK